MINTTRAEAGETYTRNVNAGREITVDEIISRFRKYCPAELYEKEKKRNCSSGSFLDQRRFFADRIHFLV